eukprot:GEMP01017556.1.p1 GENE.GEMP01017556.1~~GEMP01017556.1.p1  ORF type:complete len:518 (+),score=109.03 GEMP01017556.1:167-1555(+)
MSLADVTPLQSNDEFINDAIVLATASGMSIYRDVSNKMQSQLVGFACTPMPFPEPQYEIARAVTPEFMSLYDDVACDKDTLSTLVAPVAGFDEITMRLLEIVDKVYTSARPYKNEIRMNITRNDFMLDRYTKKLVQIELNVIAASFGGLAEDVIKLQRYLMSKYNIGSLSKLPLVHNMDEFASVFAMAHETYVERYPSSARKAILFVVLPDENNEMDQRKIERAIFEKYDLISLRRSYAQLKNATLVDGRLVVNEFEISVCYFRAGYWPAHFEPDLWPVRLMLEEAVCPKCPSAPSQLSGMKIVQQALATSTAAEHLSHVVGDMGSASELKEVAMREPTNWVLKSQIEGSGDVLFEDQMIERLQNPEGLGEFILMKKVFPVPTPSIVLTPEGKGAMRSAVGELGIYGGYVASGNEVKMNKVLGHLLRSKGENTQQGGIFLGHAVVDAPYIVKEEEYNAHLAG